MPRAKRVTTSTRRTEQARQSDVCAFRGAIYRVPTKAADLCRRKLAACEVGGAIYRVRIGYRQVGLSRGPSPVARMRDLAQRRADPVSTCGEPQALHSLRHCGPQPDSSHVRRATQLSSIRFARDELRPYIWRFPLVLVSQFWSRNAAGLFVRHDHADASGDPGSHRQVLHFEPK